jgi:hypothetical protein
MDKDKLQRVLKGDFGMDEDELIKFLQQNMCIYGSISNNYNNYSGGKSLNVQINIKGQFITGFVIDLPEVEIRYK